MQVVHPDSRRQGATFTSAGFWKIHLSDAPSRIDIHPDFSGEKKPDASFPHVKFPFDKQDIERLHDQFEFDLSSVLFTAFAVFLYRHSFQTDFVAGYQKQNAGLMPIRVRVAPDISFTELLSQIDLTLKKAEDHADSVILKEGLNALKVPDPSFFHQVIFSFSEAESNLLDSLAPLPGLVPDNENTELFFSLHSTNKQISGHLYYNSGLFAEETAQNMASRLCTLVKTICAQPQHTISSINILPKPELDKLLLEWNNTKAEFPADKCLHELFEQQAMLTPEAIAVQVYDADHSPLKTKKQLTYAELDSRANQMANYLQSLGVVPETIVGIYMRRSLDMAVALLGILKAGAAYLPLDASYPKERLEYIFEDSGISILLSQYRLVTKVPAPHIKVVSVDAEWDTIARHSDRKPQSEVTPQNICYVIYTSGSTGMPKGTLIMHRGVVNYLHWCITAYQVNKGSGSPVNSSLAFDATVTSFLSPLLAGKKVLLLPHEGEIEALVDALQQNDNFSLVKITPAHVEILSTLLKPEGAEHQARALVIGGEALTGKSLGFWRSHAPDTRLINEYGPTETVVGCCVYDIPAGRPLDKEIPIGRPIANTQIYILADNLQPVPVGVPGEIYISGEGVARGYLNRPELTASRFIKNPFDSNGHGRLYKTGDIARYLNDGNIVFLGRRDSQVKIRGYRIELGEIEHALQNCVEVSQAVVTAKDDGKEGKRLVAYFVPGKQEVTKREKLLQEQWVANWKNIYETEYGQTESDLAVDPEFNLAGWNESFTGGAIAAADMKQWLDDIVETVLRDNPKNVLEIGCGTGLIYFQLAGKIHKYIGFDLSESSIKQIKAHISKKKRDYGQTELYTAPAHLVELPPGQKVDTILLNSMVQYFPGEDYMNSVMDRCIKMIGDAGRIIIGDVRDNRLVKSFRAQLRLHKSADDLTFKDVNTIIEQDVLKEEELCLSPAYFYRLQQQYPQITHVQIQWKNGDFENELSSYRFTAILYVGISKPLARVNWVPWNEVRSNPSTLTKTGSEVIGITDAPNPRLWKDEIAADAFENNLVENVGELKGLLAGQSREAGELADFIQQAKTIGYTPRLLVHANPFKANIVLAANAAELFINLPDTDELMRDDDITNSPLMPDIVVQMQKDLRLQLQHKLPQYMLPSEFIAVGRIPLTTNGKVDYKALPAPGSQRAENTKNYVAGRDKLEADLCMLFGEALGIQKLGIHDNLFDLGLNSMQAYRIFSQVKSLTGKQLPLSILIEAPTVQQLGDYIKGKQSALPWSCLVPIQPKGTRQPLYLVHAGAGTVLFYRELSLHLGDDQPVFGLQPVGLDGKKPFHKSVQEMAAHYVKEILAVNPDGPYQLGGYCFGAVLSFEMAQQLTKAGKQVSLLCNFNGVSPVYGPAANPGENEADGEYACPQAPVKKIKNTARPAGFKQTIIEQLKSMRRTLLFVWKPALTAKYNDFLVNNYRYFEALGIQLPETLRKYYFLLSNSKMVYAYKPKKYKGDLFILRSPGIYPDPALGWGDFVEGEIKTIDIEGHHIDRRQIMNEPFVQQTAEELKRHIEKTNLG